MARAKKAVKNKALYTSSDEYDMNLMDSPEDAAQEAEANGSLDSNNECIIWEVRRVGVARSEKAVFVKD